MSYSHLFIYFVVFIITLHSGHRVAAARRRKRRRRTRLKSRGRGVRGGRG